jgi:hypothetical protein
MMPRVKSLGHPPAVPGTVRQMDGLPGRTPRRPSPLGPIAAFRRRHPTRWSCRVCLAGIVPDPVPARQAGPAGPTGDERLVERETGIEPATFSLEG